MLFSYFFLGFSYISYVFPILFLFFSYVIPIFSCFIPIFPLCYSYVSPIFLLLSFLSYFSLFLSISYFSPISGNHGLSRLGTPEIDISLEVDQFLPGASEGCHGAGCCTCGDENSGQLCCDLADVGFRV